MKKIQKQEAIKIFGDGEQTRDFLFVKETARATLKLSQDTRALGKVVNIASGKETSINDLVNIMLQIMGLEDYSIIHTDPRPGDVRRHCGGIALAQELIGFKPEISLEAGLRETIDWYRKKNPGK